MEDARNEKFKVIGGPAAFRMEIFFALWAALFSACLLAGVQCGIFVGGFLLRPWFRAWVGGFIRLAYLLSRWRGCVLLPTSTGGFAFIV